MKKLLILFSILFLMFNLLSFGQQITSVIPNHACQGQSIAVTISGQNTHFSQGTYTSIWFSQGSQTFISSPNNHVVSSNSIIAQMYIPNSANVGAWQVNVHNIVDGILTVYNGFTINPATSAKLVSVSPTTAMQGASNISVTISGQNTHFNQGTGTMAWFAQGASMIPITNLNSVSATQMTGIVSIPTNALVGSYFATVYNSIDGQLLKPAQFTVKPISINQSKASFDFDVFPNPVSNIININVDKINSKDVEIKVFNSLGKLVLKKHTATNNGLITSFDTSKLTSGVYFVQLNIDGEIVIKRIMKN